MDSVAYVTPYITDEIRDTLDLDWFSPAGQNKMRGIVRSIQSQGGTVTVISPITPQKQELTYLSRVTTTCPETGARIIVPPRLNVFGSSIINRIFLVLSAVVTLLTVLRRGEFDGSIFYNFQAETMIPALAGQSLLSCPAIVEYEDGLFAHRNTLIRFSTTVLHWAGDRFVQGGICVNTVLAERLATDNVSIIRGFPSVGMPESLPDPVESSSAPIVMFAGHLDTVRGIDTFLEVVEEISEENVEFWISGTGKDHEITRVEKRVSRMNDDRVTYFGTLHWEEYRKRIVTADILVNFQDPNKKISKYTFPSKLLDFMSAGSVIISTDMSDLASTFDNEIIIGGETETELASAVERAINDMDHGSPEKQGREAQRWVQNNCSEQVVGAQIKEVFDGL